VWGGELDDLHAAAHTKSFKERALFLLGSLWALLQKKPVPIGLLKGSFAKEAYSYRALL